MKISLTEAEACALENIVSLTDANGFSPTSRELACAMRLCQTRAFVLMGNLKRKGVIDWIPGKPRTISVLTK